MNKIVFGEGYEIPMKANQTLFVLFILVTAEKKNKSICQWAVIMNEANGAKDIDEKYKTCIQTGYVSTDQISKKLEVKVTGIQNIKWKLSTG